MTRGASFLRDALIALAFFIALMLVPILTDNASLRDFIIYVIAYGLLAMSLNLLIGYSGLVSFGHAAFFASAAYIFGILLQMGSSVPLAFLAAIGGTAFLALVIGAICIRLTEIYFAFATLAFQMFIHSIILTWVSVTGGDQGLMGGIPRPEFLGINLDRQDHFYTFCVVLFVLCILLLRQVTESPFGYTLRMIRDNPQRAEFLGVNIYRAKLLAFVLAGTVAGAGGIVLALFASGAYPEYGFWTTSGEAIFMIMLGGSQVFIGPLIGAIVLQTLNHFVTIYTEHHGLVLGAIILIAVLGLRRGIADFVVEAWNGRRGRRGKAGYSGHKAGPESTEKEVAYDRA